MLKSRIMGRKGYVSECEKQTDFKNHYTYDF